MDIYLRTSYIRGRDGTGAEGEREADWTRNREACGAGGRISKKNRCYARRGIDGHRAKYGEGRRTPWGGGPAGCVTGIGVIRNESVISGESAKKRGFPKMPFPLFTLTVRTP